MDDAERWNGQGDLMHSPFSREHLSLETLRGHWQFCEGDGLSSIGARSRLTNLTCTVGCFHQWVEAIVVAVRS